jgi:hypothetical protein
MRKPTKRQIQIAEHFVKKVLSEASDSTSLNVSNRLSYLAKQLKSNKLTLGEVITNLKQLISSLK